VPSSSTKRIWFAPAEGLFLPYTPMTRQEPKIDNTTWIFAGTRHKNRPSLHTASATENEDTDNVQAGKPQKRNLRVPRCSRSSGRSSSRCSEAMR
jgi:hypothetical protein